MKADARFRQLHSIGRRGILFAAVLMVAFCFAAPFAGAQSTGGRIRGTVEDPSGGAVPSANVRLRNEATGSERTTQSGASSEYAFLSLRVITYPVQLQLTGLVRELCTCIRTY